jgi:hypothetical protein
VLVVLAVVAVTELVEALVLQLMVVELAMEAVLQLTQAVVVVVAHQAQAVTAVQVLSS